MENKHGGRYSRKGDSMTVEQITLLVKEGGWIVLVVYFMYKEVWPLITGKLIPASLKNLEAQRIDRVDELKEEREFRHEIERQRLQSAQTTEKAIQALAVAMTQTNERIAMILTNQQLIINQQQATFSVMTDAIGDMKEAAAKRRKGDTGDLPALK
jgi:hypothetical protein